MSSRTAKLLGTLGMWAIPIILFCCSTTATAGQFHWDKFKGKNVAVRVLLQKQPISEILSRWADEFEQLTGVKAVFEILPQEQYNQKIGVEVSTGGGLIDAFGNIPAQDGIKFWRSGFIAPIEGYLKNPELTASDYAVDDFMKGALQGMSYRNTIIGLAFGAEVGMLFYRKDLFEKYKVSVPRTFDDLEQAAKSLTRKGPDGKVEVYGIVNRGRREAAGGGVVSAWLHNFGGEWLDRQGNPAINSPEAVRAWDTYSRIPRLYGPSGQTGFQWHEAASFFAQGQAAMMMDNNLIAPVFSDPEKSKVVGKVGYAKLPAGPVRDTPNLCTWVLSISNTSKNKEATWLLIQWLTNKRQQLRAQVAGASTARISAWESPEYKAVDKNPDWSRASVTSMAIANAEMLPPIVAAMEAKEIVGGVFQAGLLGQNVKEAADKANAELKRVMEQTEK